jgi:hypothetical protein
VLERRQCGGRCNHPAGKQAIFVPDFFDLQLYESIASGVARRKAAIVHLNLKVANTDCLTTCDLKVFGCAGYLIKGAQNGTVSTRHLLRLNRGGKQCQHNQDLAHQLFPWLETNFNKREIKQTAPCVLLMTSPSEK